MQDYKKKYEDALERAKVVNPGTNDYNIVTEIFPELKVSKDEKNIKRLIDELKLSLKAANCQNDATGGGHEKRIALLEWAIAWLEKQGEQKPTGTCEGCNNVKGCVACTDGDQWAHIEEHNTTWSEDDELNLNQAIYVCHQHGYSGVETWLKSLKER